MGEFIGEHLPLPYPQTSALVICVLAAALEGLLSGTNVKRRFSELQLPTLALPLWAWSLVGGSYYILFFLLLTSLLGSHPMQLWTPLALMLCVVILIANAIWNWVFFRKKDVWLSYVLFVPYIAVVLALMMVLIQLNSPMLAWCVPYVVYLMYALWWSYSIWRLNALHGSAI